MIYQFNEHWNRITCLKKGMANKQHAQISPRTTPENHYNILPFLGKEKRNIELKLQSKNKVWRKILSLTSPDPRIQIKPSLQILCTRRAWCPQGKTWWQQWQMEFLVGWIFQTEECHFQEYILWGCSKVNPDMGMSWR